ncbi:YolD-like family protein [Gracilibacillus marinus]|jgi:hypothetical protein|uniref:YolD-like family protein n=1 Tax=Gracilibacillus marinus TaxID=630535 RepID=A0ABV8VRU2_9BACI
MKHSKLTLGSNILWESSRMMLPEHKEVLVKHQQQLNKKKKPIVDEQQLEEFSLVIQEALEYDFPVAVRLFHPYREDMKIGKIKKIDMFTHELQLICQEGIIRINVQDIVHLSITN